MGEVSARRADERHADFRADTTVISLTVGASGPEENVREVLARLGNGAR